MKWLENRRARKRMRARTLAAARRMIKSRNEAICEQYGHNWKQIIKEQGNSLGYREWPREHFRGCAVCGRIEQRRWIKIPERKLAGARRDPL